MTRANEKIDHVIGELYCVDEKIREFYFKLKCIELFFFLITKFSENESILSQNQVVMVENVKNNLIGDLKNKITIDEFVVKYDVSKTTLKNCFNEV